MNFVSSSIYHKARDLALKEGLSPELIPVDHALGGTVDFPYTPIELLWDLYEVAEAHLKPGFSLRHGQQMEADDYGTLGLSWKTCWHAGDLLRRTERYMILVTDYGYISVDEDKELIEVIINRDPIRKAIAMSNETTLAMITKVIREVTGAEIYPVSIMFKHKCSQDPRTFEDHFRCQVKFDQQLNSIRFRTSDMEIPTLKADKSIHQFLLERMEEEEKGIHTTSNKLVRDVKNLIGETLPSGIPSIMQIAEHLGMSARTLNRRLAEKGYTFRDLVKEVQESVAISLLKNSSQTIGEIAFQIGFSEQSAFNRAFKRWTGQSPVEYRKSP